MCDSAREGTCTAKTVEIRVCSEGRLSERVTEIRRLGADCDERFFVSLRISASAQTKIDLRRSAELKDRSSAQSSEQKIDLRRSEVASAQPGLPPRVS